MDYLLKSIFLIVFGFTTFALSAQDEPILEKRSEIKVNAFYLVIGAAEVSYERLINEESSFGVSATYFFESTGGDYNWGITPHYRLFFGKKPALGFFVEGNGAVFGYEDRDIVFNGTFITSSREDKIGIGLGISIGAKFKTSKDVVAEIFLGVTRGFGDSYSYPRVGISVGKRF